MEQIKKLSSELSYHPLYSKLTNIENIRFFMENHVFAVWDFMSLLKSLQIKLTCTTLPWRPSGYPSEIVRLINEIVVGEESDVDQNGVPCSHFELYLRAMSEVGANTARITDYIQTLNPEFIPAECREFVEKNINLAIHGKVHEVAASFFHGREKLVPEMFITMVDVLEKECIDAPTFIYYLKRHIEVDGGDHGPKANHCLQFLTKTDQEKTEAQMRAVESLELRKQLWDKVLVSLLAQELVRK